MVFFLSNEMSWEVIVHFVNIGGIVHHHCLNFLFIVQDLLSIPSSADCVKLTKHALSPSKHPAMMVSSAFLVLLVIFQW